MADIQILPGVTDAPPNTDTYSLGNIKGANPSADYVQVGENQYQVYSGRLGKIGDTAGMMQSIASGDRAVEFPDLPEFSSTIGLDTTDMGPEGSTSMGDAARRLAAYTTGLTRKEQAQIIKGIPGASMSRDKFDNPIVRYRDERFYVNKPGATGADLTTFFATVGSFMPFGKLARIVQGAVGGGRVAGVTAMSGAGMIQQAVLDETGRQLDAEQSIDLLRTTIAGLGAGGGEFLGQALSRALSSYKLGNEVRRLLGGDRAFVNKDGTLSDPARQTMKAMGVDADAVQADIAKQVLQVARGGGTRETRENIASALPLENEFGVTLRQGQRIAGADPTVARTEEILQAGDDTAAALIRGDGPNPSPASVEGQRQAAVAALRETQEELSGIPNPAQRTRGDAPSNVESGFDIASDLALDLSQRRVAAEAAEKAAWEAAKPSMNGVEILREGFKQLPRNFRKRFQDNDLIGVVDVNVAPRAVAQLKTFAKLYKAMGANPTATMTLRRLDNFRRKLSADINNAARNPNSATDYRALVSMKGGLDDWMDDVFSSVLIKGDAEALKMLKQARGMTHAYRQGFTANKAIDAITREGLDPGDIVQKLGMLSDKGFRPEALKIVRHIKNNFDDDGVNVPLDKLRALTFMRLHDKGIRPVERGAETVFHIQGNRVSNNINSVLSKNREFMEELFTPDQIKKLQRYANMMRRVDYKAPKDVANPSGSGTLILRALKTMLPSAGGGGALGIGGFMLPAMLGMQGVASTSASAGAATVGTVGGVVGTRYAVGRIQDILKNMRLGNDLTRRPLIDKPLSATAPAAVGADVSQVPVTGADIEAARENFPSLGTF